MSSSISQTNVMKYQFSQKNIYQKYLPEKYYPYVELGRYEKPIGYMLLFWPCSWGLTLGMPVFELGKLIHMMATFYTGSVVMRAAGCIINDMWDRDFDKKVERTQQRPLAAGKITYNQAAVFLGIHLSGGLAVLTQLNWYSIGLAFSIIPVVVIYPLVKRFSHYPQFVLGTAFNWGAIVGYAAMNGNLDYSIAGSAYLAGIQWTLIYDTVYAHQDKSDDQLIGVKSTALAWGENTKTISSVLNVGQLACLAYCGYQMEFSAIYYAGIIGSNGYLQYLINNYDLNNSEKCGKAFRDNTKYGGLIFLTILLAQIDKKYNKKQNNDKQSLQQKQQ